MEAKIYQNDRRTFESVCCCNLQDNATLKVAFPVEITRSLSPCKRRRTAQPAHACAHSQLWHMTEPVRAYRVQHEPVFFGSGKKAHQCRRAFIMVFLPVHGCSSLAGSWHACSAAVARIYRNLRSGIGEKQPTHLNLAKRVSACGSDRQRVKAPHFPPIPQSRTAQYWPQRCPHAWSGLSVIVQHFTLGSCWRARNSSRRLHVSDGQTGRALRYFGVLFFSVQICPFRGLTGPLMACARTSYAD